ncbi:MAG: Crp/Fnr family transcriptional regulator [Prevotella sp.]|nr:Crp/Fnr family transcriptional regulator [Prevotella sp.]
MDIDTLRGLSSCQLFKGLTDEEIMNAMHSVRYRVLTYKRGTLFAMAGDECLHADIVISGEMTASMMSPSGKIITLNLHHSGNMLAPAFLFAADNHYPVTVEAVVDTRVLRLMRTDVEALILIDSRIALNEIQILSNIVSFLTKKVSMLSMSVREKVEIYFKEEQKKQQSRHLRIPLSRQALAEHFGIQKYSLQRCLREMQEAGEIQIEGRVVHLLK